VCVCVRERARASKCIFITSPCLNQTKEMDLTVFNGFAAPALPLRCLISLEQCTRLTFHDEHGKDNLKKKLSMAYLNTAHPL